MKKKTSTRRKKSTRVGKKLYIDERLYQEAQKVGSKMGLKISKFTELLYLQAITGDKMTTLAMEFGEEIQIKYKDGIPVEEFEDVLIDFMQTIGKELDAHLQFASGTVYRCWNR